MSEDFGSASFRDKPDMSMIWLRQMDRTNMSSSDIEGSYNAFVRTLFKNLPVNYQAWVVAQRDEYETEEYYFEYEKPFGYPMGRENDPKLHNDMKPVKRLPDGSVDWDDPNIRSPKRKTRKVTDYEKYHLLILAAAENAGLSWKTEVHTYDYGDVDKKSKKKLYPEPQILKTDSGQPYANNPIGYDTRIISTIPETDISIIDWHGTQVLMGSGYSPLFFDLIQERSNKENGTIIGWGGPPGEGKTYSAMRLGEILERVQGREFNPYIQIPFEQEHFLWLLSEDSPLLPGSVIVLDEAHFAAGARNWFKEDQKELVDMIASARNMGFIIILVVLHMSMLDNILRNFTMSFYLYQEIAGKVTAYKTYTPRFSSDMIKVTIGPVTFQLPGVGECENTRCLHCDHLYPKTVAILWCYVMRAVYERRKKYFQSRKVSSALARRKEKERSKLTDTELIQKLHENHKELTLTSHGNIENSKIQFILNRELGATVGKTKSRELAKMYKLHYPDEEYPTVE